MARDGQKTKGVLWIGDLQRLSDGRWRCAFTIRRIHPEVFALTGDDTLQAFEVTMRFVRDLIMAASRTGIGFGGVTRATSGA